MTDPFRNYDQWKTTPPEEEEVEILTPDFLNRLRKSGLPAEEAEDSQGFYALRVGSLLLTDEGDGTVYLTREPERTPPSWCMCWRIYHRTQIKELEDAILHYLTVTF